VFTIACRWRRYCGRVSWGSLQAELLPDPAATLAEGDQLVLMSSQYENIEPQDPDSSLPPRGKRITRVHGEFVVLP